MRFFIVFIFSLTPLFALQTSDRLFDCTQIFKERKGELLVELERIDEQKQALSALKMATEALLKQKEQHLSEKEEEVDEKIAIITQKENGIKKMLQKNEAILKEIQETKMSKISQTFAKMKAGAASGILSGMDEKEAVKILQSLKPKTVGQILTKMDAKKAAKLTLLMSK